MAWHRIDPRYLRQPDPDGLTLAYVSHGERDDGHLVLHLDRRRTVTRFELAYDCFLGLGELFAEWDRNDGLRVGDVDLHGRGSTPGPRHPMSPIIRRHRQASAGNLHLLLGYVMQHADTLDPHHAQTVIDALRAALYRAVERDGGQRSSDAS